MKRYLDDRITNDLSRKMVLLTPPAGRQDHLVSAVDGSLRAVAILQLGRGR
ncbi:MAG: hypothetical protein IPJ52_04445 [Rhodocyclaceae bacterium]|nr:hypothetical protein [Rhodocyclaceae bacterium]